MELAQEVGERLRRLRQDGGLSLSELARRSGVGKGTLSNWRPASAIRPWRRCTC